MSEPTKDDKSPTMLRVKFEDTNGTSWMELPAPAKEFSTGSKGFYVSGKITNPESGKTYQVSGSITLIGSKPKK
jgi:hypothetical protein